jgi:hypothetical protein
VCVCVCVDQGFMQSSLLLDLRILSVRSAGELLVFGVCEFAQLLN